MFKRIISLILVIFHLVVFGPVKDVFAFTAQSTNYKLNSGALTQGGRDRAGVSTKLWQDAIGEPCVGGAQSTNYKLTSGFIPTIQSNAPSLTQSIPYQTWPLNSSKANAFNLDAYFSSPAGYSLTYTVSGNSKISVSIDPATHMVSFSQPQDWYGAEKVYFYATDTEGTITQSNKVVLQVANTNGPNKPVIVDMQLTPSVITEGSLVKLTVRARDLDNSNLTFAYNNFFTQTNIYKDGDYWVSEARSEERRVGKEC